MECEHVRDLAPELAFGIADGADRAQALRHVAGCSECRKLLDELSTVADELLLLAPEHEPPPGFESRVLERIRPARARRPWWRRHRALVVGIASAAAAAAVTLAVVLGVTADERRLAAEYEGTLATAHGAYFEAAAVRDPAGDRAGVVFGYRGSPSWIFAELDAPYRSGGYSAELVDSSGRRIPLRALKIDAEHGSAGVAIPIDLHEVDAVRFVGREPGDVLHATLPHAEP